MSKPTQKEIDDVENRALEQVDEGTTKWSSMTYEEGVAATLRWLRGDDSDPMED